MIDRVYRISNGVRKEDNSGMARVVYLPCVFECRKECIVGVKVDVTVTLDASDNITLVTKSSAFIIQVT
jgi:hypothetical protein